MCPTPWIFFAAGSQSKRSGAAFLFHWCCTRSSRLPRHYRTEAACICVDSKTCGLAAGAPWGGGAPDCRCRLQVSKVFGMVESDARMENQALQGMHIVVLPQSCANTQEQKELADLVARAGAEPSGAVKPGRGDRVIVGRAPRARYRVQLNAHIKRHGADVDVLTCDWLESCLLCNADKRPLPRHFVHICTNTALALAAASDRDECGSTQLRCVHRPTHARIIRHSDTSLTVFRAHVKRG